MLVAYNINKGYKVYTASTLSGLQRLKWAGPLYLLTMSAVHLGFYTNSLMNLIGLHQRVELFTHFPKLYYHSKSKLLVALCKIEAAYDST